MPNNQDQKTINLVFEGDLEYWGKLPEWNLHEAVLISFGLDPHKHKVSEIKARRSYSKSFLEKYEKQSRLIASSTYKNKIINLSGPYSNKLSLCPLSLVEWAKSMDIAFPQNLAELVFKYHNTTDYQAFYEQACKENQELKKELEKFEDIEKDVKLIHPREKDTLLKIIAALLLDGYGFDPTKEKNEHLKEIRDALASIGYPLDDDTIRDKVNQSKQFMPMESSLAKPNSARLKPNSVSD